MAIPKIIGAQRDFSAGELDVSMKRADESPVMKTGARQAANWRILNSKIMSNRPGRTALFFESGRVDEVLMSPGNTFFIAFGAGYLRIYNAAGTQVFSSTVKGDGSTAIPWTANTVKNIVWTKGDGASALSIFITYGDGAPNNVPQTLTWDGVSQSSTWTLATYAETITPGAQKRTPFYRMAPPNITLKPSATTGAITLLASAAYFVNGMIGTRLRFCGRQVLITAVTDSTHANATVQETLPQAQNLPFVSDPTLVFVVGDEVIGASSGAKGIVTSLDSPSKTAAIQLLQFKAEAVGGGATGGVSFAVPGTVTTAGFNASETIVGPGGGAAVTNIGPSTISPQPVAIWDEEVMNSFRGFPSACFYDQSRLGFNNFPALPSAIAWSGIGLTNDLYPDALPDNAIFELAPGKPQVLYVVPGMESSEFVFCDTAIFYIPIGGTFGGPKPLVPGSVAFNELSAFGCAPVQPRRAEQSIVFVKAGGVEIGAVQALGAYYRPFIVDSISELHAHLFTASAPIAIAIPSAPSQFVEKYLYILFANGTLAVGKYAMKNGMVEPGEDGKPKVGWLPWNGNGTASWISAQGSDLIFTSSYPRPVGTVGVIEKLDATQYLDAAVPVNNLPAAIAAANPGGKGPLYWLANGNPGASVFLIDQGTRIMGVYQVDANGNIVPQGNDGENLTLASLVAGQAWTATLEPFVPDAPPGQSQHQRMFKRRVSRMAVYVSQSTGFLLARLFSGPLTPTSPVLGTIMNTFRIPAWNQGDDPTKPPPLREEAQRWRPLGRSYDPRVAVVKDTPGPLLVHEIGFEDTI